MKKIFKKAVEPLTNVALMYIMLTSAQRCMNLPFTWASIGYLVTFTIGLTIWTICNPTTINKENNEQ